MYQKQIRKCFRPKKEDGQVTVAQMSFVRMSCVGLAVVKVADVGVHVSVVGLRSSTLLADICQYQSATSATTV